MQAMTMRARGVPSGISVRIATGALIALRKE